MDIVNSLKDEFIQNDDQTPFFVFQVTGREAFVEDAHRLDALRDRLALVLQSPNEYQKEEGSTSPPMSLQKLLEIAEQKAVTPELISSFTNLFFDTLIRKVSTDEFSEYFDLDVVEHSNFEESSSEAFIIRVMSRQDRPDEFVTAKIKNDKPRNLFNIFTTPMLLGLPENDKKYREEYELQLNCNMHRTQIRFSFKPKFCSLRKLVLIVSCAPSLNHCYIFEIGTQHKLTDFNEFSNGGIESTRRWYKLEWSEDTSGIVNNISTKLHDIVRENLEQAEQSLSNKEK